MDKVWKFRFIFLLVFAVIIVIYSLKIESHSTYVTYNTPTPQTTLEPTVEPTPRPTPEPTPEPTVVPIIEIVSLGEFRYTYYSATVEDCGNTKGITFTGAKVWDSVTVAVDPNVIPLGSYIYLEHIGYRVALDIGSAVKGNIIDIYVDEKSDKLCGSGQVYLLGGR